MSVYLIQLIRDLSFNEFNKVIVRAHVISFIAFVIFAIAGESIFEDIFKVRFASFLIFGGIVFLMMKEAKRTLKMS